MDAMRIVVVFRIKGGDCYEIPTIGFKSYRWAVRGALYAVNCRLSDVILCRE